MTVYQLFQVGVNEGTTRVDIIDRLTIGPFEPVEIDAADAAVVISTIDNDEDKFTTIRGQQCTITFLSSTEAQLENFLGGPDDRFLVEVYYNGVMAFRGFLMQDDNRDLWVSGRNPVVLTATDKLGALKDIPLVDSEGKNPQGKYTFAKLCSLALAQTGQQLNINIANNLRAGSGTLTASAAFFADTGNLTTANTDFFYDGQVINISGSGINDGIHTVTGVDLLGTLFVGLDTPPLDQGFTTVTFTDILTSGHLYNVCYLDARTFEAEIGESEDCYTVLQKILTYDCTLFFYRNAWWICRTDERELDSLTWGRFNSVGDFFGFESSPFWQSVGENESNFFANEATNVRPSRELGLAKLTFQYEFPEELFCNQDLGRAVEDFTPTGADNETFALTPECIDYLREGSPSTFDNLDQSPFAGATGNLIKKYESVVEKESYLSGVIAGGFRHYFKFQPLDVNRKDKVQISFSYRPRNPGITNIFPAMVLLLAEDGTIWAWNYDEPTNTSNWVLKTGGQTAFTDLWRADLTGIDLQDEDGEYSWQSITAKSPPIPRGGQIVLRLISANATYATEFTDLDVDYFAFINGSYPKFTGQSNSVTRTELVYPDGGKAKYLYSIDERVSIGDAPSPAMKGAIFFMNQSGRFKLVRCFVYQGRVKSFGWHQVQAVWNQYRNGITVFEYDIVSDLTTIPHLIHRWTVSDITGMTANRFFILITFEIDLRLGALTGTMPEVYRTDLGKIYTDPFEFKYITR